MHHLTGSRIRDKRLDCGLKQAALAEAVGISPSYLNLIEHNRRRIGGKLLADLAHALGVEPATLTEGADNRLLDQLRAAAATSGDMAEMAKADELALRYPGWSGLIAEQARRISELEQRMKALSDRMASDPQLSASLHEVISAVTAIRSSAAILMGSEPLDADWQRRFHENIHSDSLRLAASSEALIAFLEAPPSESDAVRSPLEEAETYLARTGFHLAVLETSSPDLDRFIAETGLSAPAKRVLERLCRQYVVDALALPSVTFTEACRTYDYAPAALAQHFQVDFATVLRRLASLPPDQGHPPIGIVTCDASGTQTFCKPVPGFTMPRSGGGCPLWPVFSAFGRPSQPVRVEAVLPGTVPMRFLCYAIAEPINAAGFDAPPALHSTMLIFPEPAESHSPSVPVGITCRTCPRENCSSRREPAVAGLAPML